MAGPISATAVRRWLQLDGNEADEQTLAPVVAAVNSQVTAWKGDPATWPDHHVQGAVMLAGRVHLRRNSVAGVASFGETAVYVSRNDPEVAQLLEIGQFERPHVG